MPLWHNRQPNPEMNPAPGKKERDDRKTTKDERAKERRTDRADDQKGRDWVKQQRRKDR